LRGRPESNPYLNSHKPWENHEFVEGNVVDGYWPYVIVAAGGLSAVLLLFFATRSRKKKRKEVQEPEVKERSLLGVEHSVTHTVAKRAQDELRTLEVEREILSYAIRRLYEAEAEGKIDGEERERLGSTYKKRMVEIKNTLTRNESLVALHELEGMQEDLLKLFSERLDDLNQKIEELRSHLDIKIVKEVPIPSPPPTMPVAPPKIETKRRARPSAPRKTEAEERIEKIRAEIEKVLERLGQIETEA
jgi:hypothetical protein